MKGTRTAFRRPNITVSVRMSSHNLNSEAQSAQTYKLLHIMILQCEYYLKIT